MTLTRKERKEYREQRVHKVKRAIEQFHLFSEKVGHTISELKTVRIRTVLITDNFLGVDCQVRLTDGLIPLLRHGKFSY